MSDIVSPLQNISYTNKDFTRIYEELLDLVKELSSKWDPSLSNESDPGVILLKLNAIIADKCNYNIDKSVLECFPLSVTQLSNARQLFAQLGYFMKWKRSATTQVTINWSGETTYPDQYANIEPFTMVTDKDETVVYTLLGPYDSINKYAVGKIKLLCDGASSSSISCNAIQGVPVDFSLSGNKLITVENLDNDNRLYFADYNVAENGVFITNAGEEDNYNKWERKDNLSVENYGNYYYKFGVSKDGNYCYLEFPEDVETLFGEGVYIKYIRTDANYGNINANSIYKFYNDITAELDDENIILNPDVITMFNPNSANDGEDYESINDAYKNYKRTVGTFKTLVTLRDYINAIVNSGMVSNGFVCDRTNDIQTTYKVLSSINNIDQQVNYIEEIQQDGEDITLNAFSLKLYLLNYSSITQDYFSYANTFEMMTNEDSTLELIKKYIEDEKCIQHDYTNIIDPDELNPHPVYFRNTYPIECNITAQTTLNNQQKQEIKTNIVSALRNNLSSKDVEFGENISYDLVYNIIKNSDPRIKNVSLFNINYSTEVVYYDSKSKLTYNNGKWYDDEYNVVNPSQYGLVANNPIEGATLDIPARFKSEFINGDFYDDVYFCSNNEDLIYVPVNLRDDENVTNIEVNVDTFYNKLGLSDCYKIQEFICDTISSNYAWYSNDEEVNLSNYGISFTGTPSVGDKLKVTFDKTIDNPSISTLVGTITPTVSQSVFNAYVTNIPPTSSDLIFEYKLKSENPTWKCDGEVVSLSDYGITILDNTNIQAGDKFKIKLSYAHQVKYDLIAKSILTGVTQFYIKDETFDYRLNQISNSPIISNVANICGDVEIKFNQNKNTYKLRDNESLQLYCPNLIDKTSYSNYVKFEYYITQNISANSNYQLRNNEFIIFYWTESDNESGAVYKYYCYGNGTIICPTFALSLKTINDKNQTIASRYNLVQYDSFGNTVDSYWSKNAAMSLEASEEVSEITSTKNILSGSKKIIIKGINSITINRLSQYYLYWILNDITTDNFNVDKYVLFEDGQTSRMLETGEYLIYTDSYKKNYEILGSGTMIERNTFNGEWAVNALDSSDILLNGISSIEGNWFTLSNNDQITITENAFTNIGSGCTINITAKEPRTNFYTLTSTNNFGTGGSDDPTKVTINTSLWYKSFISAGQYTLNCIDTSENIWTCTKNGSTVNIDLEEVGITIDNSVVITTSSEIIITVVYSYELSFNKDGYKINIPQDSNTSSTAINLSNFDIKYRLAGSSDTEENWVVIDNVTLNNTIGWNGRSMLALNFGPKNPQYILSNQKIHLKNSSNEQLPDIIGANKTYYITKAGTATYELDEDVWNSTVPFVGEYTYTYDGNNWKNDNDEIVDLSALGIIVTSANVNDIIKITNTAPAHYPTVVLGSFDIDVYGAEYSKTINITQDDVGLIAQKYLSIYSFSEMQDITGEIVYSSNGSVGITFPTNVNSRSITFKIPAGNYMLPVKNNIPDLDSLTVSLDGTLLTEMYSVNGISYSNIKDIGIHYLKMIISDDNLEHTLTINMQGQTMESSIVIDNCYKYNKPYQYEKSTKIMSDNEIRLIEDRISYLDNKHVFKYDNIVEESRKISNPVSANAFNNVNHIYNKFTICEFTIANIN